MSQFLALITPLSGYEIGGGPVFPPGGIAAPPIHLPPVDPGYGRPPAPPVIWQPPVDPGYGRPALPPYATPGPLPPQFPHVPGTMPPDPGYGQGHPLPPHVWWGGLPPHAGTGP